MDNLYRAKILAYSKSMFVATLLDYMQMFMDNFDPDNMMLLQYRDVNRVDLDIFLDSFRRTDGQYVFMGNFYFRGELEEMVKPYCKEVCISVAPKMPKNNGDYIDTKKDYGYLTVATMSPVVG